MEFGETAWHLRRRLSEAEEKRVESVRDIRGTFEATKRFERVKRFLPDPSMGLEETQGPGGVDLEDQDPNNGCGNDDDFEDDNEGRCSGRRPNPSPPPSPSPSPTPPIVCRNCPPPPDCPEGSTMTENGSCLIPPVIIERCVEDCAVLPETGSSINPYLALAGALISGGGLSWIVERKSGKRRA